MVLKCFTLNRENRGYERENIWGMMHLCILQKRSIQKNDTIRYLKKYCQAYSESDMGKNRYFETGRLVKGAESGCYFAIQNLDNQFSLLCHSLSKYPDDVEAEKSMMELSGLPTPSSFNNQG